METIEPVFASWESFYVIVGSSAAALTGLMFVVVTLVSEASVERSMRDVNAFASPSVVHFCGALFVSALFAAPWTRARYPGTVIVVAAVAGLVYSAIVVRRMFGPKTYQPVLEDWVWHVILPILGYVVLLVSGLSLEAPHHWAAYTVGTVTLLLLFIGIHNAWDTVTYLVTTKGGRGGSS